MRAFAVLVFSLAVAPPGGAAPAGSGADETAIQRLIDDFSAAWGRHDAKGLVAGYDADADFTNPLGRTRQGRADIEAGFASEHGPTGLFRSSTIRQTIDRLRLVKPDVGVVQASWEITGAVGPDGAPLPPAFKGRLMLVVVKRDGQWKVISGQAMQPVADGPPPAR
jgi:uncharacterized protein (TIGR02246 family)